MSLSSFLKLIYNEQIKLYIKKSTLIMYIILAALIIDSAAIIAVYDEELSKTISDNEHEELQTENDALLKENKEVGKEEGFIITINNETIAENNYYLEHDIKPSSYGAFHYVHENQGLLSLISLFTII